MLLAACGGKAVGTPNGNDGNGTMSGGADGGSQASAFDPSQVQAAQATCTSSHGHAVALSSGSVAIDSFVGSWLLCSDATASPSTMFAPGIQFAPDGSYSQLVSDGSGGLVRATGVQSQGTWSLTCDGSRASPAQSCNAFAVTLEDDAHDQGPVGYAYGLPAFEDSPRRLYLPDYYDGYGEGSPVENLWLVQIP